MRLLIIIFICVAGGLANADQKPGTLRLSLAQALQKAETISVGVLVADARVAQAMARFAEAKAPLLPQIDGSITGARQTRDLRGTGIVLPSDDPHVGPFNSFDVRGRITQTVFDAGALARLRAAKAGEELSAVQMQKAKEDALALIAVMYIQAKRAQEHVQLTRVFLKRDKKIMELAKIQYDQGTGSLLEFKQTKADYLQSMYVNRAADAEALQRRLDVAAALQIPADMPVIFETDDYRPLLEKIQTKNTDEISPDIKVAQQEANAQAAQAKAAAADFLPKISAVGDYGRTGKTPDQSSYTYMLGVQASVPIWEGGSKQARVTEAKAKVKEARAVLEDTRLQSEAAIINARARIAEADALVKAKAAQLAVADEQMKTVLHRQHWGIGHELDVDIATAQKVFAEDEGREAVALLWMSKITLAHALGQMRSLIQD